MPDPRSADELFQAIGQHMPAGLADWESRLAALCREYQELQTDAELYEIAQGNVIFVWDMTGERVVIVYGLSAPPDAQRDAARMRGFPDPNPSLEAVDSSGAKADRGHFVAHTAGGALDMNLFPQRRDLNRGWSAQGKQYRGMERYVAEHPGTFFYHRPRYTDDTWVPTELELAIYRPDATWWIATFSNRGIEAPPERTELISD